MKIRCPRIPYGGEIESVSHLTSSEASSSGKKKLKNKRLDYVRQHQEELAQHIQFRSEDSASASNCTAPEVSEETLQKDTAGKEVVLEPITDLRLCETSISGARCESRERDRPRQLQSTIPQLSPEAMEELEAKVRKDSRGNPMSLGCASGVQCIFCHFPHRRGTKQRPGKQKRDRYYKIVNAVEVVQDN